jgi:BirA family biotin operon repressor/biotin-[acetyl-CoA-carboxylase] ligase
VEVATTFLSRRERFARVGSTNDVVREWLAAGTPEVCLAVAEEQTSGRGRDGRSWLAPSGAALLLSLGFRPTWLDVDLVWRLPTTVSLAMAHAAEAAIGAPAGTVRLKWPNDLLIDGRKVAGVLGESVGLGSDDPRVIVGIGINVEWPRDDFPPELAATMTSLLDVSGRGADLDELLDGFLAALEAGVDRLRADAFDAADWKARQLTTGRVVELHGPDGRVDEVRAVDVDAQSGALVVEVDGRRRSVFSGEIRHLRVPPTGNTV